MNDTKNKYRIELRNNSIFVVITDMHLWSKNIQNRKDYKKECDHVLEVITGLIYRLRKTMSIKYKIYLVFLGDVFHRGESSPIKYNSWIQVFTALRALVNGIFSVVGNHEISFEEDNPFWGLLSEVRSKFILAKGFQPQGALPIINVVDHIDIKGYRLHFNHFGSAIYDVQPEKNVLFSHQYWSTKNIFESLLSGVDEPLMRKYAKGNNIKEDSVLRLFDYCFFGHNHMLKGVYQISWDDDAYSDTVLYYLASLGLTKRGEVQKMSAERVVPILIIDDKGLQVKEENIELLHGEEEVLDREEIAKRLEQEQLSKQVDESIKEIIASDDPIEDLRRKYENNPMLLECLEAMIEGRLPSWIEESLKF